MKADFEHMTIAIVGLGLIGGSFARAIKKNIPAMKVLAVDLNTDVLKTALKDETISAGSSDPKEIIPLSDIVILCAYPKACVSFLMDNLCYLKSSAIVTDVTGVKGSIVRTAQQLPQIRFVGGHPMAGRESKGYACSADGIFDNAQFIFTPTDRTDSDALYTVQQLMLRLGFGRIITMDPDEHDRAVAFSSQLPHILATALMSSDRLTDDYRCIAGSFKDATRVADINPELWWELYYENRDNMAEVIKSFADSLTDIADMIKYGDCQNLTEIMERGRSRRKEMMS